MSPWDAQVVLRHENEETIQRQESQWAALVAQSSEPICDSNNPTSNQVGEQDRVQHEQNRSSLDFGKSIDRVNQPCGKSLAVNKKERGKGMIHTADSTLRASNR